MCKAPHTHTHTHTTVLYNNTRTHAKHHTTLHTTVIYNNTHKHRTRYNITHPGGNDGLEKKSWPPRGRNNTRTHAKHHTTLHTTNLYNNTPQAPQKIQRNTHPGGNKGDSYSDGTKVGHPGVGTSLMPRMVMGLFLAIVRATSMTCACISSSLGKDSSTNLDARTHTGTQAHTQHK